MEYINGYGLDKDVYESLVNHFYGFEEYVYYKKDEYYKDYIFIIRELDNIKNNKPMLDAYKHAIIGWYISFKNLERRMSPKTFIFKPTDACQLRCKHCYNQTIERYNKFMTYDEFVFLFHKQRELITKFYHYRKEDTLDACYHFESGEPTLNKDLSRMIRFCNRNGYRVRVLTNGIYIPEDVIDTLKGDYRNRIQISFDGMRDTHDFIRGSGTFDKAIHSLKVLKERGVKVSCNFTATLENYTEYDALKEFLASYGVDDIICGCFVDQNNDVLHPLDKVGYQAFSHNFRDRIINPSTGTPNYSGGNLSIISHDGEYISDVHSTGIKVTNYFTDSIEEMLCKIKKHVIRLRSVPVYCFDCKKVDGCLGGMLCSTFKKYGKYNIEDMACHILGAKERGEMYEIGTL